MTFKKDYKNGYTEYYFCLPSCGDVSIDLEKNKIRFVKKNYKNLKRTILTSRNNKSKIYWQINLTISELCRSSETYETDILLSPWGKGTEGGKLEILNF